MVSFTFEFIERTDELGRVKRVAIVRKLEGGGIVEHHTSGPSADVLLHEIEQWYRRTESSGSGLKAA